jgi:hypothetical protein
MNQQVLSNKRTPIDIRRRLYQAIVVYIRLWGSESWALKEEDISKLETFHHGRMRLLFYHPLPWPPAADSARHWPHLLREPYTTGIAAKFII